MNKDIISLEDFLKVKICVGTILNASENNELNNPSFTLTIDFGKKLGIKKSSAQLRKNYAINNLINKQILAVVNFKPKQTSRKINYNPLNIEKKELIKNITLYTKANIYIERLLES